MKIKKTQMENIDTVIQLYEDARKFMKENGNPSQWGDNYPPSSLIQKDIKDGNSYICIDDGEIVGTFCLFKEEPTYAVIYQGSWRNDKPYVAVHRVAASGRHGVATFCLQWCIKNFSNVRIDTHRDNVPMQKLLAKNGFYQCGIIYIEDGSERLAYQN